MAERDAQPGDQLVDAEWLGHVVVGASLERLDLLAFLVPAREDDDRRGGLAPDPPDDLEPIHVRQPQVEQDEVRPARLPRVQRRPTVWRLDDPVAARGEVADQRRAGLRVILDHEDGRARLGRIGSGHAGASAAVGGAGSRGQRQLDVDREPAELAPPGADPAAHRLDQAAHDGQADARCRTRDPPLAPGHPVELLEQPRQRLVRHAGPAVLDRQPDRRRRARAPRGCRMGVPAACT